MRMKPRHFLVATLALSLAACGQQSLPDTTVKDAGLGDAFFTSLEAGQPTQNLYDVDETAGGQANLASPFYFGPSLHGMAHASVPRYNIDGAPRTGNNVLEIEADPYIGGNLNSFLYFKVFDVSIPVISGSFLEYWVYPRERYADSLSSCVSMDLVFTDGTVGRNLGAKDQNGRSIDPAAQCGTLPPNTWTKVRVNYGSIAAGKTIDRIFVGYHSFGIPNKKGIAVVASLFDDIRIGTDDAPRVFEAESSGWHGIGHAESDGWSANPSTDGTGHLIYGPYVSDLRPGPHTANFTMLVGDNAGPNYNVATIGVWNVTKQRMEGSRTVTRNEWNAASIYQDFQFDFQNSSPGDELSFLLYWYGGVTYLKLDKITVY